MFLASSKLLASLTFFVIIAVTDADTGNKCDAKWKAYGFEKNLNDLRREEVQRVVLQKQGEVKYACVHEQTAAQIRDEVLKEDPKFIYGLDLVFAGKKKLKIAEEVTFFPQGMLEDKLQEIDIVASSFGCARSDGTEQPPPPKTVPKNTTVKNKKNNGKKKNAGKPKKKRSGKAKMPAKAVKGKSKMGKGQLKPKGNNRKGKGSGKGNNKKKGQKAKNNKKKKPKPNVKPPTIIREPTPLKTVYFVCVYKLNTGRTKEE